MKIVKILLEMIGWLQIVLGVTIVAALLAFLIYFIWQNDTGKFAAIVILSIGFILGAVWATSIWIKHGTIAWLSRIRRIS